MLHLFNSQQHISYNKDLGLLIFVQNTWVFILCSVGLCILPNHGLDYPGSVSKQRNCFVHQRMSFDEIQHFIGKGVGGAESRTLDSTSSRPIKVKEPQS